MNAEDKQDILDFIDFYVVLGIVHRKTLCKYLGISVRTIQRWRKNGTADKRKGSERKIPRKLTPEERRRIYQELCSPEYKDLNPNEIYNSLLDKGIYLASSRTFYRILKEFNASSRLRQFSSVYDSLHDCSIFFILYNLFCFGISFY